MRALAIIIGATIAAMVLSAGAASATAVRTQDATASASSYHTGMPDHANMYDPHYLHDRRDMYDPH